MKTRNSLKIFFVSLAVVLVDQISKLLVKGFSVPFIHFYYKGMSYGESVRVIGNFFRITFIENPGLAFGFDPGINLKFWIFLFSLIASIALFIYLYIIRNRRFITKFSVALILGGAIGNLIDRMFYGIFYGYAPLFYGRVVDFLDFDFFKFSLFGRSFDRWPIFNFADAAVTVGVLLLIFFYPKEEKESELSAGEGGTLAVSQDNDPPEQDLDYGNENESHYNKERLSREKKENVEPNLGKNIQDTNS